MNSMKMLPDITQTFSSCCYYTILTVSALFTNSILIVIVKRHSWQSHFNAAGEHGEDNERAQGKWALNKMKNKF